MATQIGTATNFLDLYNKLRDFLVSDATLVGLGQNWAQIGGNTGTLGNTDEIVLQGPGLAGNDEVLIGLRPYVNTTLATYNIGINGMVAYNPALAIIDQVNVSGTSVLPLWNSAIDYWFIANGRRFMVVARISTYWMNCYAGLILPYVLPDAWPYPLFVGGSNQGAGTGLAQIWSTTGKENRSFWNGCTGCAKLLLPDVTWWDVSNWSTSSGDGQQNTGINTDPFRFDAAELIANLDGSFPMTPATLLSNSPYQAQLGRFDGVYGTIAIGNAAGNIIQQGGVDHLVVQNIYRTARYDYAAFALQ
ncbi:MAG: hypothetical protein ACREO4_09430 [Lysobacter sp.]